MGTAGPQSAKRFLSMCTSTKVTGKQAAELICERARRLYLGLDDSCGVDTDSAIMRLLTLIDALAQENSPVGKETAAEPMLQHIGLVKGTASSMDLLGTAEACTPQNVDLLGGLSNEPSTAPATATSNDLLL